MCKLYEMPCTFHVNLIVVNVYRINITFVITNYFNGMLTLIFEKFSFVHVITFITLYIPDNVLSALDLFCFV